MKAKGWSGSRRFSAKLKCTRPTRFHARFRLVRNACNPTFAAARDAAKACSISSHNASKTSSVRYSAPAIIGAVSTRDESSAAAGAGMLGSFTRSSASELDACRQSDPTYRAAKSRHQTNKGGNACPASAAPSHTSPYPVPRAKASIRRIEAAASMSGPSSWSSTVRRP